jgi:hypothetical protein
MTTICADAQLVADAAGVLAALRAREPDLERSPDAPLDPCPVNEPTSWLDSSDTRAAAALDRLRASDAAAPHPPGAVRAALVHKRLTARSCRRVGMPGPE